MMVVIKHALKNYNRQKAEIERLEKHIAFEVESAYDRGHKVAIKEFAERLKVETFTKFFCGQKFDLIHGWIDDLVKEMVGERE